MIEKVRSLEARPSGFFLCVKTYTTTEITDKYKRWKTTYWGYSWKEFFFSSLCLGLYVVGANKWSMITDHYSSMPTMRRERANHSPWCSFSHFFDGYLHTLVFLYVSSSFDSIPKPIWKLLTAISSQKKGININICNL